MCEVTGQCESKSIFWVRSLRPIKKAATLFTTEPVTNHVNSFVSLFSCARHLAVATTSVIEHSHNAKTITDNNAGVIIKMLKDERWV